MLEYILSDWVDTFDKSESIWFWLDFLFLQIVFYLNSMSSNVYFDYFPNWLNFDHAQKIKTSVVAIRLKISYLILGSKDY